MSIPADYATELEWRPVIEVVVAALISLEDGRRPHYVEESRCFCHSRRYVMTWLARVVFLLLFALFWGGLTFYAGFVVRISHDVLNDPMDGGLITQRVTALLQTLGLATVVAMVWNAVAVSLHSKKSGYALAAVAALVACSLVGLFIVHHRLDSVIDIAMAEITNRDAFEVGHRRYNQFTTIAWLGSLAYLALIVHAWQSVDRKRS